MSKIPFRKTLALLLVVGLLFLLWRIFTGGAEGERFEYDFVTSGDVETSVSASGTLRPAQLIEVGAEVSGKILAIDVDFNDQIVKGQRLGLIDPSEIEERIITLEASLERTKGMRMQAQAEQISASAELKEAERELVRASSLLEKGVLSPQALDPIETRVALAKAADLRAVSTMRIADADISSAESALKSARIDLARTVIVSPVDGIVLERAVEVGQTLTAGFETPLLFKIAADDGGIVLEARIDEADIGGVREGQTVNFTVDAFPDTSFAGHVTKVRRAPNVLNGVTSYPVIIAVNADFDRLFPGMTALVSIVTQRLTDALRVPNRALSFDPDSALGDEGRSVSVRIVTREESERIKRAGTVRNRVRRNPDESGSIIWKSDGAGSDGLVPLEVELILRGDNYSAISSRDFKPGDRIAVGIKPEE